MITAQMPLPSQNKSYLLLLSDNPCDLFQYFDVKEMHGLNSKACEEYSNSPGDAYIAGLCNIDPRGNQPFVFINLSRCTNDIKTMGLVMHELMHLSGKIFKYDFMHFEEEMITFAETESYKVLTIIKSTVK